MTQGIRDEEPVWEFLNGRLLAMEMLMKGILAHQIMEQKDTPPSIFLRVIEKRLNAAIEYKAIDADIQSKKILSHASQILTKMCDEIEDVIDNEK